MTSASQQALSMLRHTENMQWYIIPLLVAVFYAYFAEIEKRNWSAVYLSLAFWAAEFTWEQANALVLHFTDRAPVWCTPGKSAFIIYSGLNIEISFFFAIYGLMLIKILPEDKSLKVFGLPNRWVIPTAMGLAGMFVEMLLNRCDMLIWEYSWWGNPHMPLIAIGYCAPLIGLTWLHDNLELRTKKILAIALPIVAAIGHVVFAVVLKWI